MNELLFYRIALGAAGILFALFAAWTFRLSPGNLSRFEAWPRRRLPGMLIGWAALAICVPHAEVVSPGFLVPLLWPLAKKFLNPQVTATNVDSVIGSVGRVTVDIDNVEALGQVKLGGMEWSARSTSGEPIPAGIEVRVDRVEGVKVFVTPVEATVTV